MRRSIATATILALSACAIAAEPAPPTAKPVVVAGTQQIRFSSSHDLAQVAKVRFFASNNQGKSWILAGEIALDQANPTAPQLDFKAPSDGAWAFFTTAILRDGRTEPEPVAGTLPANALIAEVDNTAPVVGEVQATIDQHSATSVTVGVTWIATEVNPAGTTVEVSGDQGRTFVAAPSNSLQGYVKVTVPRTPSAEGVLVKVTVRDAAGNSASSAPRTIPLPRDSEQTLAAAVAALPAPAEIIPVEKPETVIDEPATTDPVATPVPETAKPAVSSTAVVVPPPPAAPEHSAGRAPGPLPKPGFLRGAIADDVLTDARALAASNEPPQALERYMLLRTSDRAGEAIGEELALRNRTADARGVVDAFASLDPELRTDAARIETARAHLTLSAPDQAVTVLARLGRGSERYREALLLVAVARDTQGRRAEATKLYEHLAAGNDAVATEAKLRRGK
jgi:hypothetical protein